MTYNLSKKFLDSQYNNLLYLMRLPKTEYYYNNNIDGKFQRVSKESCYYPVLFRKNALIPENSLGI